MYSTVDNPKNTVKTFDQVYNDTINVNASEYDIVYSYFRSISETATIANNFTLYLFRISAATGVSAIELLENFKGKPSFEMTSTLSYYLNTLKSNTTLYGIAQVPVPNQTIQRNIVV
jgi:hypothetical protein